MPRPLLGRPPHALVPPRLCAQGQHGQQARVGPAPAAGASKRGQPTPARPTTGRPTCVSPGMTGQKSESSSCAIVALCSRWPGQTSQALDTSVVVPSPVSDAGSARMPDTNAARSSLPLLYWRARAGSGAPGAQAPLQQADARSGGSRARQWRRRRPGEARASGGSSEGQVSWWPLQGPGEWGSGGSCAWLSINPSRAAGCLGPACASSVLGPSHLLCPHWHDPAIPPLQNCKLWAGASQRCTSHTAAPARPLVQAPGKKSHGPPSSLPHQIPPLLSHLKVRNFDLPALVIGRSRCRSVTVL
jgi:hypothetical protein